MKIFLVFLGFMVGVAYSIVVYVAHGYGFNAGDDLGLLALMAPLVGICTAAWIWGIINNKLT